MKTHTQRRLATTAIALALGTLGACASAPAPCPTTDCPVCEAVGSTAPESTARVPVRVDLRDRTPQLDRGVQLTLEAMSADGALALLDISDSARGRSYRVVELATEKTKQTFDFVALGEQGALKQAMKALGKNPVTRWSQTSPAGDARAFVTEAGGELVLFVQAGSQVFELAILPRHLGADDDSKAAQPASVSGVTVAWAPNSAHIIVIYRQVTVETPTLKADRWFSVPVQYPGR